MSSAMVSLGIGTGFERQYKVLKRLGRHPARPRPAGSAPRSPWSWPSIVIQVVVLVAAAFALGLGARAAPPAARAGGRAARHRRLRRARPADGRHPAGHRSPWPLANGLYLVLLLLGGMIIPFSEMPSWLATIGELTPAGALSTVMQSCLRDGAPAAGSAWVVLAVWAVAMPRRRHPPLPLGVTPTGRVRHVTRSPQDRHARRLPAPDATAPPVAGGAEHCVQLVEPASAVLARPPDAEHRQHRDVHAAPPAPGPSRRTT